MSKVNGTSLAIAAGSSLLIAGMGAGALTALADAAPSPDVAPAQAEAVVQVAANDVAEVPVVLGDFSFTQSEVTPTEDIARRIGGAPQYLCGSTVQTGTDVSAEDWVISVGGDVANPYSATISELQEDPAVVSQLMGCSCAGNPADGLASVNAKVTGIAVCNLVQKAGADPAANTIVFVSADGYEVALPLDYVTQRFCPIVFDVNDSPIAESVGGTNQLWLGSTAAKYFARDIVSIQIETRDEVPAAPGSEEADRGNLPNVGVYFGGEVQ